MAFIQHSYETCGRYRKKEDWPVKRKKENGIVKQKVPRHAAVPCHANRPIPVQNLYRLCSDSVIHIQLRTNKRLVQLLVQATSYPWTQRGRTASSSRVYLRAHCRPAPAMRRILPEKSSANEIPLPTPGYNAGKQDMGQSGRSAQLLVWSSPGAVGDIVCGPVTSRRRPALSKRQCRGWSPLQSSGHHRDWCSGCRQGRPSRPLRAGAAGSSRSPPPVRRRP